jgi:uncharacterized oligopeptide transporter (OPT) family protein
MGCIVLIIFLAFPRIALIPLIGFIFLPLTTLVYAWIVNSHLPLSGLNLIFLVIAVLVDLGSLGGGASRRRGD